MRRCFIGVNLFDSLEIGCQVSGVRRDAMATKDFLDVEDLAFFSLTPVEDPAVRGTLTPEH